MASEGGSLEGQTYEWVWWGEKPTTLPTPVDSRRYEFRHWELDGEIVNPLETKVFGDTEFVAVFEEIPLQSFQVDYAAGPNGRLQGQTAENVIEGEKPAKVPTPVPDEQYEFAGWTDEYGVYIEPANTVITADRRFTANFKYVPKEFNITLCSVKHRTTSVTQSGETVDTIQVTEGDRLNENMFDNVSGIILNSDGEVINNFNSEVPTKDTWYQEIDDTESLTTQSGYYRKTFYAGHGGKLIYNGAIQYSRTQTRRTSSSSGITTPDPSPDDGFYFVKWINLATGDEVSNPSTGTTTAKYAAIFAEY